MSKEKISNLRLSELVSGAQKSLDNAVELFNDAVFLAVRNSTCRAYFFHQISLEECGKIEIIGVVTTNYLMGVETDRKYLKKQLSNHKAKNNANAYFLEESEEETIANAQNSFTNSYNAFEKAKNEFHTQSNNRKNASIYVDYIDNNFISPSEQISKEMLVEIAKLNHELIGMSRKKVHMLREWEKNPKDAIESLATMQDSLQNLAGETRDQLREEILDIITNKNK